MMSPVGVKFCGITRVEDARLAAALGARAIGFVFWSESPRAVSAEVAAGIANDVGRRVERVGVFVNATAAEIGRIVAAVGLDVVQLHGDEELGAFRRIDARIVRALAPASDTEVEQAAALESSVTVLVDAAGGVSRGGTGQLARWDLAAALARRREIWLAGGLSPTNVAEAIRAVRPALVDVSSGVEVAPGVKDHDRMRAFVSAVERAGREAV